MPNDKIEPYLTLGCFGREEDGFVLCSSCQNKILKIHDGLENFNEIIDFFYSHQLFERPSYDFNEIKNILQLMDSRFIQKTSKLWSQKELESIQKFLLMHRPCGLFLKLEMDYPKQKTLEKDEYIFIPATSKKLALKNGIKKRY